MMQKICLKKRRGLHTIIGAVFFVLVMGSTIGYVTYSMGLVDNLAYQIDAKQDANLNRQSEEFEIVDVNIVSNEFNVTLKNTGTLPINVTKMWAKNMTDSSWNQTSYQINQIVSPGGKLSNVGVGTGLVALDSESYSLKLLTGRGNALETQVVSAANQPLEMTLYTSPSSPLSGQNVTLLYSVKNNLTEGIVQTIIPDITDSGTATATPRLGPVPASAQGLNPGEIATFEYMYTVTGTQNQQRTFDASIVGAPGTVSDTVTVDIAPVAEQAINEVLNAQLGKINMNFTSFHACHQDDSCESDSTDWIDAWSLSANQKYFWRLNVTNNGLYDIYLDEKTTLIGLPVKDGGGGNAPTAFFIREDNTPTDPNGAAYNPNYQKVLKVGESTVVYFGSQKAGQNALEKTDSNPGIVAVIVTFFGWDDVNGSGGVDGGDTSYSQAIPFQAYSLT